MALMDSLVAIPGTGFVYIAPVGTAKPASLTDPDIPWVNIGHTSADDGLTIARDGGDSKTLGSWQNPTLKVQRDPVSFSIVLNVLQVDNDNLSMYFGGGDASVAGVFGAPIISTPQEKALFVRIVDGANEFPFYVPKVSIASDDDIELDTEKILQMPLRATILGVTGSNLLEFYGSHLGLQVNEVQQIAITGTATGGTFTLTFSGQTTGPIVFGATAAQVKTALVALSNIDASDVACTGGPLPGTPVVVTFQGKYEDTDVPVMTGTSSLTGTSPVLAITTTTPGGN